MVTHLRSEDRTQVTVEALATEALTTSEIEGKDLRKKPYTLFRVKIDAGPVLLK